MGTNCTSIPEFRDTKRIGRLETRRQTTARGTMRSAKGSYEQIEMLRPRVSDENGCGSGRVAQEFLGSLYVDHHRHVLQVCRRFFRRPEDAEDAAAEVFLKLYRVLHTKDEDRPFRPWVCQVAGRHCIDKLRERRSETRALVSGVDMHAVEDGSTPSALSRILQEEARLEVREELNRLPRYYRIPLILRYYKRMSYLEIARTLGRGLPAVRTIIFRAKRRLRRNLQAGDHAVRGIAPTPSQ